MLPSWTPHRSFPSHFPLFRLPCAPFRLVMTGGSRRSHFCYYVFLPIMEGEYNTKLGTNLHAWVVKKLGYGEKLGLPVMEAKHSGEKLRGLSATAESRFVLFLKYLCIGAHSLLMGAVDVALKRLLSASPVMGTVDVALRRLLSASPVMGTVDVALKRLLSASPCDGHSGRRT